MKRIILLMCLLAISLSGSFAQQLPYYTQNVNNEFMLNPGVTGTKRFIDARVDYRKQWVGYDGAPTTASFGLHSRFLKGKMGAGIYVMNDKIGPLKQTNFGASYAIHFKFPDCELSAGVAGNFAKYTLAGSQIMLHNSQDPAIDQYISNSTTTADASAGIYLYNDRFHIGVGALHALQSTAEFYKQDTTHRGLIRYETSVNVSMGYNYSQNPDFVWENNLSATYLKGMPFMFDYTLLLHVKKQMFGGISIRLHDAIALHLGVTIHEDFQIAYSYDIQIGKLQAYNSGSHEIMLIFSSDIFKPKHGRVSDRFLKQKYGYLL